MLRVRAVAATVSWLPLILDASKSGNLLFVLPSVGLLLGILPVRWFPVIGTVQVAMAVTVFLVLPRRTLSNEWLFFLLFALAILLNLALWLRTRSSDAAAAPPARDRP